MEKVVMGEMYRHRDGTSKLKHLQVVAGRELYVFEEEASSPDVCAADVAPRAQTV